MYTWVSNGESNNPPLCPFPPRFPSGSLHTLHYGADVPKFASPHWPRLRWGEGLQQHPLSHAASSQVGESPLSRSESHGGKSLLLVSLSSQVFSSGSLCILTTRSYAATNKSPASTTLLQTLFLQLKLFVCMAALLHIKTASLNLWWFQDGSTFGSSFSASTLDLNINLNPSKGLKW